MLMDNEHPSLAGTHDALNFLTSAIHNDEFSIAFDMTFKDEVGIFLIAVSFN
jgi:hypothetical protein